MEILELGQLQLIENTTYYFKLVEADPIQGFPCVKLVLENNTKEEEKREDIVDSVEEITIKEKNENNLQQIL